MLVPILNKRAALGLLGAYWVILVLVCILLAIICLVFGLAYKAEARIFTMGAGGFIYNIYHPPVSVAEVEGMRITGIVIESNGKTPPEYFRAFLRSKKGERLTIYNIKRDINAIRFVTRVSNVQTKISTNGLGVILYYRITENETQGMIGAGISGAVAGVKFDSWNYNGSGSKYTIGLTYRVENGVTFTPRYILVLPDAQRYTFDYTNSNYFEYIGVGWDNFDFNCYIYQMSVYNTKTCSYGTIYGRRWSILESTYTLSHNVHTYGNSLVFKHEFEPWVYIPFWKHAMEYAIASNDILPLDNRGYYHGDYDNSTCRIRILEEAYLSLRPDEAAQIGAFIDYTSMLNKPFISVGVALRFNIFSMGKGMTLTVALPLVDNGKENRFILQGGYNDLF